MAAAVFLVDPSPGGYAVGETIELTGAEGRHAATVRRLGVGDRFVVTDGAGAYAEVTVTAAAKDRLTARIDAAGERPRPHPTVTVVQALPKSDRGEQTVDALTEAGADRIVPWQAARCVARWRTGAADKSAKALERWRARAREAGKQARRLHLPQITELYDTAALTTEIARVRADGGAVWVLHESATDPLPAALAGIGADATEVMVVVGPEGGIGGEELGRLTAAGATAVRLGPQVLRTALAGALALAVIGAGTDRWSVAPVELGPPG